MTTAAIDVARIRIELTTPLSLRELGVERRLRRFVAGSQAAGAPGQATAPLARVAMAWEAMDRAWPAGEGSPPGELVFDPGSIWKMYRAGSEFVAAFRYGRERAGELRASADWTRAVLGERRAARPRCATGPRRAARPRWESLLNTGAGELVVRAASVLTGGLVLHASSLDDNGRGLVFVGHSGAGKTTQLALWGGEPGTTPMNDDCTVVRVEPDGRGPMCYGTPWGGLAGIARNHAAPLAAVVILEQAASDYIELLPARTAVPLLAPRAFLPYWDAALMARALANLGAIASAVPVYRLQCRPTPAAVALVRSVL